MIIEKFRTPTRYDLEPYGTIWQVKIDDMHDSFIQINKDRENSTWIRLGPFFEKTFDCMLDDALFVKECLNLYENQDPSSYMQDIADIPTEQFYQ